MGKLQDILRARAEYGLAALLLDLYDAGYCAGGSLPLPPPEHPGTRELIAVIAERHRIERLTPRGWVDPPLLADELPGWLLRQIRQADVVEGWGVEGAPV